MSRTACSQADSSQASSLRYSTRQFGQTRSSASPTENNYASFTSARLAMSRTWKILKLKRRKKQRAQVPRIRRNQALASNPRGHKVPVQYLERQLLKNLKLRPKLVFLTLTRVW